MPQTWTDCIDWEQVELLPLPTLEPPSWSLPPAFVWRPIIDLPPL